MDIAQYAINIAALGSIYLLFALGMALTWGTIGILNFAHGVIFMFATLLTSWLDARITGLSAPVLIAFSALMGALLSVIIQIVAFGPILKRAKNPASGEMAILIGGIGVAAIPLAIAYKTTESTPFGWLNMNFEAQIYEIGGVRFSNIMLAMIIIGVAMAAALGWWMKNSKNGLALRAISIDPETASLMGANENRLALGAMAAAGAFAGLAGGLLMVYLTSLSADSGNSLLLKAFAIIVLGGLGSMLGVTVGAFALAALETFLIVNNWASWTDAIAFGLIVVVLLIRPQGLFGRKEVRRT